MVKRSREKVLLSAFLMGEEKRYHSRSFPLLSYFARASKPGKYYTVMIE